MHYSDEHSSWVFSFLIPLHVGGCASILGRYARACQYKAGIAGVELSQLCHVLPWWLCRPGLSTRCRSASTPPPTTLLTWLLLTSKTLPTTYYLLTTSPLYSEYSPSVCWVTSGYLGSYLATGRELQGIVTAMDCLGGEHVLCVRCWSYRSYSHSHFFNTFAKMKISERG